MTERLAGKVAIITGGASGIGEATARVFAREGAKVLVADVQEDLGKKVVAAIRSAGGEAEFVPTDVKRDADIRRMVETAEKTFGRLDVLVNNAGVENVKPDVETSEEEWDHVLDVNLKGVFLCTKHAIGAMKKSGGGSIINISSIFGLVGSPGFAAYHASKGGVRLLTKSTALAHASDNIRANGICPGVTQTPMFAQALPETQNPDTPRAERMETQPRGRVVRAG